MRARGIAVLLLLGGGVGTAGVSPPIGRIDPAAFTSFVALHRGSTIEEAERLFGSPSRRFPGERETVQCVEFPPPRKNPAGPFWAAIVCHERAAPHRVTAIQTNRESLDFYRARHADDDKLSLYAASRAELTRRLGKPQVVSPDGANFQWRFAGGRVAVTADTMPKWRVESIEIEWEYE